MNETLGFLGISTGITALLCGSLTYTNKHNLSQLTHVKPIACATAGDYVYCTGCIIADKKRLLTASQFKYYPAVDIYKTTKSYEYVINPNYFGIDAKLKKVNYEHFKVPFTLDSYKVHVPFAPNFPAIKNTWYVQKPIGYEYVTTSAIVEGSCATAIGKLVNNTIEQHPTAASFVTHKTLEELSAEYEYNAKYYKIAMAICGIAAVACLIGASFGRNN